MKEKKHLYFICIHTSAGCYWNDHCYQAWLCQPFSKQACI